MVLARLQLSVRIRLFGGVPLCTMKVQAVQGGAISIYSPLSGSWMKRGVSCSQQQCQGGTMGIRAEAVSRWQYEPFVDADLSYSNLYCSNSPVWIMTVIFYDRFHWSNYYCSKIALDLLTWLGYCNFSIKYCPYSKYKLSNSINMHHFK